MRDRLRIAVTGAGGYVGRHVVRALLDQGHEVVAVGRNIKPTLIDQRATVISADIFELVDPFEAFGHPDVCVHLAWESGFAHMSVAHMSNLSRHFSFLTGLVDSGLGQLLVLGTMHEIGYFEGAISDTTPTAPQSLYGVAKDSLRRALELYVGERATVFQWVRCFYIYGDDEHNSSIFTKLAAAAGRGDRTFPFTSGTNRYDFIAIDELADQISAVALQSAVSGLVHCGSGVAVALGAQVERYIAELHLGITLDYGAYPDRTHDSPATWADTSTIRRILAARDAERAGKQ